MYKLICSFFLLLSLAGCATSGPGAAAPVKPAETVGQQLDAARKVVGGMVVGTGRAPVIKYSPTTGKHYSSDLEFDPETGEKLEVLPE